MDQLDKTIIDKIIAEVKLQRRNADMIQLRDEGWTLQKIGDKYGLTRERVRQIINQYNK